MYVCSYGIHFYNDDERCDDIIVHLWDDIGNNNHATAPLEFHHTTTWSEKRAFSKIISQEEYNKFFKCTSFTISIS